MSNFSPRARWAGVSARKKVALLMAAAALGVAAATPWLFDDGSIEQSNISTGRNGGPRAVRRGAGVASSGGQLQPEAKKELPPGSPLPLAGNFSELFDGGAPKQTEGAVGGGEAGPGAGTQPDTVAGATESEASHDTGGAGMGGKVGVKPATFGNTKGFIAERR